jgi:hypothetical protein
LALHTKKHPPFIFTTASFLVLNPQLSTQSSVHMCRVGQNHIYTVYIRYVWQGNHQIYGHIRCIYTVLANPMHMCTHVLTSACSMPSLENRMTGIATLRGCLGAQGRGLNMWCPGKRTRDVVQDCEVSKLQVCGIAAVRHYTHI